MSQNTAEYFSERIFSHFSKIKIFLLRVKIWPETKKRFYLNNNLGLPRVSIKIINTYLFIRSRNIL